jgi:hypothetical protein
MKKKRPPLKKKRSFTECGLKFEDGLEVRQKFKDKMSGSNLIEEFTVIEMKKAARWPISEALLNRPDVYVLAVDSLMNEIYTPENVKYWADYKGELAAPAASEFSDEDIDMFYESGRGEEEVKVVVKSKIDPMARFKAIDKRVWEINNFKLSEMIDFPFKAKDNVLPLYLLNNWKLDYFEEI